MAGNATVTLYPANVPTTFEIWVQNVSTSSQNEFANSQVRAGMSWNPIRRAEQFFNFTAVWPLISVPDLNAKRDIGFEDVDPSNGFRKMNLFQDTIYAHYNSIAQGSTTQPMTLTYYNNTDPGSPLFNTLISKTAITGMPTTYQGFIKSVEKQYVRFQNMFVTSYQMNIINPNTANTAPSQITNNVSYAPTAKDQQRYGNGWLLMTSSGGLATNAASISGLPSNGA